MNTATYRLKTGEAAWQRAMRTGAISSEQFKRFAPGNPNTKGWLQRARDNLSGFVSELSPWNQIRDQKLQARLRLPLMAHHQVDPHNLPGMGPATNAAGVHVDIDTGTMLRNLQEGGTIRRTGAMALLASGHHMPEGRMKQLLSKPQDPGITNAVVRHELAENRMLQGHTRGAYAAVPAASHAGPGALLAERLGVKDPAVHAVFDKMRASNPDDARMMRLMRQHGYTPNNVPALGGRVHRSLDAAVERMPVTGPAVTNRVTWGTAPIVDPKQRTGLKFTSWLGGQASKLQGPMGEVGGAARELADRALAAQPRRQNLTQDQVYKFIGSQSA